MLLPFWFYLSVKTLLSLVIHCHKKAPNSITGRLKNKINEDLTVKVRKVLIDYSKGNRLGGDQDKRAFS